MTHNLRKKRSKHPPDPDRFRDYEEIYHPETHDIIGFRLPDGKEFFLDEYAGWFDEYGNYYNGSGEPATPPYEVHRDGKEFEEGESEDYHDSLLNEYDILEDNQQVDYNIYDLGVEIQKKIDDVHHLPEKLSFTLLVSNIERTITEKELEKFFNDEGTLKDILVEIDEVKRTPEEEEDEEFTQTATVTLTHRADAAECVKKHKKELRGKEVIVDVERFEPDSEESSQSELEEDEEILHHVAMVQTPSPPRKHTESTNAGELDKDPIGPVGRPIHHSLFSSNVQGSSLLPNNMNLLFQTPNKEDFGISQLISFSPSIRHNQISDEFGISPPNSLLCEGSKSKLKLFDRLHLEEENCDPVLDSCQSTSNGHQDAPNKAATPPICSSLSTLHDDIPSPKAAPLTSPVKKPPLPSPKGCSNFSETSNLAVSNRQVRNHQGENNSQRFKTSNLHPNGNGNGSKTYGHQQRYENQLSDNGKHHSVWHSKQTVAGQKNHVYNQTRHTKPSGRTASNFGISSPRGAQQKEFQPHNQGPKPPKEIHTHASMNGWDDEIKLPISKAKPKETLLLAQHGIPAFK